MIFIVSSTRREKKKMNNSRDRKNVNRNEVFTGKSASTSIVDAAFYTHVTTKTITADRKLIWKLIPITLSPVRRNGLCEKRERERSNSSRLLAKRREAFTNYWQTEIPTIQHNENDSSRFSCVEENLMRDENPRNFDETFETPVVVTLDDSFDMTNRTVCDLDSSIETRDDDLYDPDGLSTGDTRSTIIVDTAECKNSSSLHDLQQDTADVGNEMTEVDAIRTTNEAPDDTASSRVAIKSTTPELLAENVGNESPFLVKIPRTAITLNLNSYGPLPSKKNHLQSRPSPEIRIADSSVSDIENTRYLGEKFSYRESIDDQCIVKKPKIVEDVTCVEGMIIPLLSLSKLPKILDEEMKIAKTHNVDHEKRKRDEENNQLYDEKTVRMTKKSRLRRKFRQLFGKELSISEFEEEESMIDRFVRKKRRKCNSRVSQDSGVCLGELASSEDTSIDKKPKCPIESELLDASFEKYASSENIILDVKKDNDDSDQNLRSMPSLDILSEMADDKKISETLPDSTNTDEKSIITEVTRADSSNDEKLGTNRKLRILITSENTESPDAIAPVSLEFDLGSESQTSTPTSTTGYLLISQNEQIMSRDDITKMLDIDVHKDSCDVTLQGQTLNVQQDEGTTIIMMESPPSTPEIGDNLIIDEDVETGDDITNLENFNEVIGNIDEQKSSLTVIDEREQEQDAPMDLCSRAREIETVKDSNRAEMKNEEQSGITSIVENTGNIANEVKSTESIENNVGKIGNIASGDEISQNVADDVEIRKNVVNDVEISQNMVNGVEISQNITYRNESVRNVGNDVKITQTIANPVETTENNCLPLPPVPKFRVLHHHELGSRWCPTPLNNGTSIVDTQHFQPSSQPYSPISPFSPITSISPTLPILNPQIQLDPVQQANSLGYLQQMTMSVFHQISNNLGNLPQQTFANTTNLVSNAPGTSSILNNENAELEESMSNIIFNYLHPLDLFIKENKFPTTSYKFADLRNKFTAKKKHLWLEMGKLFSILKTNNLERVIRTIMSYYNLLFPPGLRVLSIQRVEEIFRIEQLPLLQPNVDQPTNIYYPSVSTSLQYPAPPPYPGISYFSQNSNLSYVPQNFIPHQHPLPANPKPPRVQRSGTSGYFTNNQLRTFHQQVSIYKELIKTAGQQLTDNPVKEKRKRRPRKKAPPPQENQINKTTVNGQETRRINHLEETILRVLQEAQQSAGTVNQQQTTSRVQPEAQKSCEMIYRLEMPLMVQQETRKGPETFHRQQMPLMMQQEPRRDPETFNRQQMPLMVQPETRRDPETFNRQKVPLMVQPETSHRQERPLMVQPETLYRQEASLMVQQEPRRDPETFNRQQMPLMVQPETRRDPETFNRQEVPLMVQPETSHRQERPLMVQPETLNRQEASLMVQQEPRKSPETFNRQDVPLMVQPETSHRQERPLMVQPETLHRQEASLMVQQEPRKSPETFHRRGTPLMVQPQTFHRQEAPLMVQPETRKSPETLHRQEAPLMVQPETRKSPETLHRHEKPLIMQPDIQKSLETFHWQETSLRMQPEIQENFEMINRPETIFQSKQETRSSPDMINHEKTVLRTQQATCECLETIDWPQMIKTTENSNQTRNGSEASMNDSTVGIADVLQEFHELTSKTENYESETMKSPSNLVCDESPMIPGGPSGCNEPKIISTDTQEQDSDETEEIHTRKRLIISPNEDVNVIEKINDEDEKNCNNENFNNEDKSVVNKNSEIRQYDVITLDDCDSDESNKTQDAGSTEEVPVFSILDVKSISKDVFNRMNDNDNVENESSEIIVDKKREKEIMTPECEWSDRCFRCGNPSSVVCERCYLAFYCSAECHEVHWTEMHHLNCKPVPVERLAELKFCDRSS